MIIHGDSLEKLKDIADESVDLLCTDPPYGYSFMGKAWDKALPDIGIFKECLRVLKPGGFAFVMSAPRSDVCSRMAILLEDAGFNIAFTPIYWTYASGFPKAMNIGKMVDKREGVDREVIGKKQYAGPSGNDDHAQPMSWGEQTGTKRDLTAPATDSAKALDGSYGGFQPKPAVEVVIVAMKPLSEKTYVDQALKNGKGITWLDDCRVPTDQPWNYPNGSGTGGFSTGKFAGSAGVGEKTNPYLEIPVEMDNRGRFPANLLVEGEALADHSRFFSLDAWAQTLPFLIVPKASKREKNAGLEGLPKKKSGHSGNLRCTTCGHQKISGSPCVCSAPDFEEVPLQASANHHPTVKPLKLMSYLITLGSWPGDTVLDPFMGSGSTCIAAKQLGREYVGIEREAEYVEIAEARIAVVNPTLV